MQMWSKQNDQVGFFLLKRISGNTALDNALVSTQMNLRSKWRVRALDLSFCCPILAENAYLHNIPIYFSNKQKAYNTAAVVYKMRQLSIISQHDGNTVAATPTSPVISNNTDDKSGKKADDKSELTEAIAPTVVAKAPLPQNANTTTNRTNQHDNKQPQPQMTSSVITQLDNTGLKLIQLNEACSMMKVADENDKSAANKPEQQQTHATTEENLKIRI
jgi:hypothetical protein